MVLVTAPVSEFYIPNNEMPKLFVFKEKMDNISLFEDESGKLFFKQKWKAELHPILLEEWINEKKRWTDMVEDFEHRVKECQKTRVIPLTLCRWNLIVAVTCLIMKNHWIFVLLEKTRSL